MAKPSNSDDPHPSRWFNIGQQQRVKDGNATAQEGTGALGVKLVRQREDPGGVGPHPVGKASMVADYGTHRRGAEVMIAGFAPFASQAGVRKPSQTDPLTDLQSPGLGPRAVTVPTTSCPGTKGYVLIPHALSSILRSL